MIWLFITATILIGVRLLMPVLIAFLQRKAVLDMPNARSSHSIPTPRGAGWLAMGLPIAVLLAYTPVLPLAPALQLSLGALGLALLFLLVVSGLDDRLSLTPLLRLLAHTAAAALVVFTLPDSVRVFPDLPFIAEKIILLLGTIWMINLTNFIDGINGITAANGLAIAGGVAMAACLLPAHPSLIVLLLSASLIAGGLGGFLYWNVPDARIFLGDSGSIPLGLWQAYVLIFVSAIFGLVPALLMCLYPLLDATFTLFKRALKREKIWQAHRSHFYQQAVQNGRTHARTSKLIFGFNVMCLFLACVSILYPSLEYGCLAIALISFVLFVRNFTKPPYEDNPA